MCRILTQALIQATIRNTNLQLLRSVCLPSIHERPKNRNDRGTTIEWSNQPPNTRGRQTSSNVTTGRIGMRGQAKTAKKPWEACELFFTNEMLSLIVAKTNRKNCENPATFQPGVSQRQPQLIRWGNKQGRNSSTVGLVLRQRFARLEPSPHSNYFQRPNGKSHIQCHDVYQPLQFLILKHVF